MKILIMAFALLSASTALAASTPQMKKYKNPSDAHKKLAELAGNWDYTMKFQPMPETKIHVGKGKSRSKMILGGRILQEEFRTNAGNFEGFRLITFDNMRQEYQTIWADNSSTGFLSSSGTMENDVVRQTGRYTCPIMGDTNMKFRSELKVADKDHYTYLMISGGHDGKEFTMMEISYTRAK